MLLCSTFIPSWQAFSWFQKRELPGDLGSFWELPGDLGSFWELPGDLGSFWELPGDLGSFWEIRVLASLHCRVTPLTAWPV
jgi:hypothetical protein